MTQVDAQDFAETARCVVCGKKATLSCGHCGKPLCPHDGRAQKLCAVKPRRHELVEV